MEVPVLGVKAGKEEVVDLKASSGLRRTLEASVGSAYSDDEYDDVWVWLQSLKIIQYDPPAEEFVLNEELVADMNNVRERYGKEALR